MNIIIDTGHPAHVHYFRNIAIYFSNAGHQVIFTTRDKEVTVELLKKYQLNFLNIGKPYKSIIGKIIGLLLFEIRIFIISIKFKPDLFLSAGSIYAAHIAWLLGKPHITLEDTFNKEQVKLYLPFTDVVFTGNYAHPLLGKNEIHYNGYQELLYLHPNYFTPDSEILKELNIEKAEKYFVLRFVSWNASHDRGQAGLTLDEKRELISILLEHGKVIISSEKELPEEFERYRYSLAPEKIHNVLAYAYLFIGEGATMASECTVLGVPAIYINSMRVDSISDQEKYGIIYQYRNGKQAIQKIIELLEENNITPKSKEAREKLLSEKIDVTSFLIWFIENYPESHKIMKENPKYQYNFR